MQEHGSNRLMREREQRMLGGVCAGIARQYGLDVTMVRVVMAVLSLAWGVGVVAYIALWVLMPERPAEAPGGAGGSTLADAEPSVAAADPSIAHGSTGGDAAAMGGEHTSAEDITMRARRAADELAVAARNAAEVARTAADRFTVVAQAATEAGRRAWHEQQHGPAAHEAPSAHAPVAPPPPHEVTGSPGPDDARAEQEPKPGV
jgi:phage shock protein PspC (stress-responsive transcriptional regulator)